MITLTGRTFDHRQTIVRFGGVWDKANKHWIIKRPTPDQIAQLRKLVGVVVSDRTNSSPSNFYGDDPTYHHYFAPANPAAFFGFSSLGKLTDYLEAIPRNMRGNGWEDGNAVWSGTDTMQEALEIARKGWPEGATAAQGMVDRLTLASPRQRRHKASLAGGSVNVGRMLSGDPAHMISRPKLPGEKVITLFVEAGCMATINAGTMVRRALIVGAITDIMENQGYSCTIVAVDTSVDSGRTFYQMAVVLKLAGERMHLGEMIFALGHPAFSRRFSFAVCSSVRETREIWETQGSPANAFTDDHPCASNEFYVPVIKTNTKTVDETLPLVVPKNLPIALDNHRNDR